MTEEKRTREMTKGEAMKHNAEVEKIQKALKYSDLEIRVLIDEARLTKARTHREHFDADASTRAVIAQAMMSYNAMIDRRWA